MNKTSGGRDYTAMAARDHEMLAALGERAKKMFIGQSPQYVEKQIADIKLLLNETLVPHFAYEEGHVFPQALAANLGEDAVHLIATLKEEHQSLLAEVWRLNKMLADQKLTSEHQAEVRQALLDLFTNLQDHAAQEDGLFRRLVAILPR